MPTDVDLVVTLGIITFRPLSSFPPGIEGIGIRPAVDNVLLFVANSFQIAARIATFIYDGVGGCITMVRNVVADIIIAVDRDHLGY